MEVLRTTVTVDALDNVLQSDTWRKVNASPMSSRQIHGSEGVSRGYIVSDGFGVSELGIHRGVLLKPSAGIVHERLGGRAFIERRSASTNTNLRLFEF